MIPTHTDESLETILNKIIETGTARDRATVVAMIGFQMYDRLKSSELKSDLARMLTYFLMNSGAQHFTDTVMEINKKNNPQDDPSKLISIFAIADFTQNRRGSREAEQLENLMDLIEQELAK